MFGFGKKNVEIEEQVLEEVTDEQLSQVTGGAGLTATSALSLTAGTVTLNAGLTASATVDTTTGALTANTTGGIQAPPASITSTTATTAQI